MMSGIALVGGTRRVRSGLGLDGWHRAEPKREGGGERRPSIGCGWQSSVGMILGGGESEGKRREAETDPFYRPADRGLTERASPDKNENNNAIERRTLSADKRRVYEDGYFARLSALLGARWVHRSCGT